MVEGTTWDNQHLVKSPDVLNSIDELAIVAVRFVLRGGSVVGDVC